MKLKKSSFLALILISVPSFAIERTKYIMGTYISINLPSGQASLFKPSFDIFKNVDKIFSKYRPDSYVFKLNNTKKAKLNKEFLKLLTISLEVYKKTDGYFDITLGNITKKYGSFYKNTVEEKEIKKSGVENIVIKNGYVYLKNNISLDFGGIGKGYAIDEVSNFLDEKGVKNYIIKASGDIRCQNICRICVKNPFGNEVIACFKTKNKNTSISTSGNYERYIKSKDNNHLINPKTKKPEKTFASITLIGIKNNTYLDAYTTAVSVMPEEKAISFLNNENISYLIIKNDKKVLKSKNLENYISDFQWYGF